MTPPTRIVARAASAGTPWPPQRAVEQQQACTEAGGCAHSQQNQERAIAREAAALLALVSILVGKGQPLPCRGRRAPIKTLLAGTGIGATDAARACRRVMSSHRLMSTDVLEARHQPLTGRSCSLRPMDVSCVAPRHMVPSGQGTQSPSPCTAHRPGVCRSLVAKALRDG